jgi:hypothetical protein
MSSRVLAAAAWEGGMSMIVPRCGEARNRRRCLGVAANRLLLAKVDVDEIFMSDQSTVNNSVQ